MTIPSGGNFQLEAMAAATAGALGFAGISVVAGAAAEGPIGSGGTYTQVGAFNNNLPALDSTSDVVNDQCIAGAAGVYRVSFSASHTTDTALSTYTWGVFVDAVITLVHAQQTLPLLGEVGNLAASAYLTLTAGQLVDLRVTASAPATNIVVTQAQLTMERLS